MREFRREGRDNFRRNDRSGGSRFGPRDRGFAKGPPRMFDATCSKCGKQCQVPFRPTGSKPVLCSECFRPDDRAPRRDFRSERRPFSPQQSSPGVSSAQLEQINAKLDTILRVLKDLEIIPDENEVEEEDHEGLSDDSDDDSEEN